MQDLKPDKASSEGEQAEAAPDLTSVDDLVTELLQSAPKSNADKIRVLRAKLKRLSVVLPPNSIGFSSAASRQSKDESPSVSVSVSPSLHTQPSPCCGPNRPLKILMFQWMSI